ncbi:GNAT family N-acetyltransferase [Pseudomonas sp. C27(2019)]|uniref:GNAT family N-acetyltransferase n=1 Tax=Pseudomonas sp. C27(2019) TaxID=2604941 RepID=UPI001243DDEB|nr:GNAT family N-acetyltransferase [Pseudomonas sp. C27(2019)]QEY57836.1 GNAT family N-acetyltransferase [Pseudomonas sp. C27(2019)]
MRIISAGLEHLDHLLPMFIRYRELYGAMPQLEASKDFLLERLNNKEAIILLAYENDTALGFCLVYPSFSSVSLRPIWIINDLYVAEEARRKQVANQLLKVVAEQARSNNVVRLRVSILASNDIAQRLYESAGFLEDKHFRNYILPIQGTQLWSQR